MTRFNLVTLFLAIVIIEYINFLSAESNEDLPLKSDLLNYLDVVQKIAYYCNKNTDDIDLPLAFGIFVANVNIKHSIKHKGDRIPNDIREKMINILMENKNSLQVFNHRLKNDTNFLSVNFRVIHKLLSHEPYWMSRLEDYVYTKEKSHTNHELLEIYSDWGEYNRRIDKLESWVPGPEFSDICLVSLAINRENKKIPLSWCPIKGSCYGMLKKGTNFGYALTHRFILLLLARLGRGCYVFTELEDNMMKRHFCSMSYAEADYIAMHGYRKADLVFEIMLLCSLDGHSQFLRRKWLQELLPLQSPQGCYQNQYEEEPEPRIPDITPDGRSYLRMNYNCNPHTTAVAFGTYSSVVRFIIQEYY